jgi:hypothetical protein
MVRLPPLAVLSVAFILASCSDGGRHGSDRAANAGGAGGASPDDGAAASDEDTSKTKKDICTTLDYGHDRTNEDYFLQFADDAAAATYSRGFLAANDISDPASVTRDARTLRLVGRVYDGIRKVFPRETAGMDTPPRVFTVQNDTVNAFAGYDERREYEKAPWIFWVHQGTMDSRKSDAQLEALFAHELGHLVLRNMLPETRAKIRTHYRVAGGREQGVLGETADDDDAVRTRAEELRTIGGLVGREPVFGVIPVSAYEDSDYQSLLGTLANHRSPLADRTSCAAADNGVKQARAIYRQNVSTDDLTLILAQPQIDQLTRLSDTTRDALRKCYPDVKKSLLELKIEDLHVQVLVDGEAAPLERLLDPSTPEHKLVYKTLMTTQTEKDVDAKPDLTTAERIIQVVDALHARAAVLVNDSSAPIDELRVYDLEEDADDASVRVLRALGDDTRGATELFTSQLDDPSSCTREIANGSVPRYGRFVDPHNATCWRAFHTIDLANALARCPSAPVAASSTAKAPNAAAASSGMRLVQQTRLRLR